MKVAVRLKTASNSRIIRLSVKMCVRSALVLLNVEDPIPSAIWSRQGFSRPGCGRVFQLFSKVVRVGRVALIGIVGSDGRSSDIHMACAEGA